MYMCRCIDFQVCLCRYTGVQVWWLMMMMIDDVNVKVHTSAGKKMCYCVGTLVCTVYSRPGWSQGLLYLLTYGSHKKVFLLDIVKKGARPPLILDIREVTFVSAHFGQPWGNFCKGPKIKYLPNIKAKVPQNFWVLVIPHPSPHLMSKRRSK